MLSDFLFIVHINGPLVWAVWLNIFTEAEYTLIISSEKSKKILDKRGSPLKAKSCRIIVIIAAGDVLPGVVPAAHSA